MYPSGVFRSRLVEDDIVSAVFLQQQVMPNPWSEQAFRGSLNAGDGCFKLVKQSQIIAVAVISQVLDEAELLTIAVAEQEQGQGLATSLLSDLMSILKSQSASQCMLEVMEGNESAINVYKRIGFAQVATRKAYYHTDEGIFDALVMRIDY
jgi:ribosomal-protein-alanine N-acetyltransferase